VQEQQLVSPPWQRARSHIPRQFLTSRNITVIPHPPIRLTSPLATFSYSPQDEITAERESFWHKWVVPHRIASGYRHNHIWELPGMHEIIGENSGITVFMPKGPTSKETVETRSYGKKYFVWSNSPNFWVAPRKFHIILY
jgi:hypothetical protein